METDPELLPGKAQQALERYGHQMVVGNILETRKKTVTFFMRQDNENVESLVVALTPDDLQHGVEIESQIVPFVIKQHKLFQRQQQNLVSAG